MVRLATVSVLGLLAAAVLGADDRLYLRDGDYHIVREYEAKGDRVRFYSTERGEWEEMPLDLIDLERTEAEIEEKEEERQAEAEFWEREEAAEKAHLREVASVPEEEGAYLIEDGEIRAVPPAALDVVNHKRRSFLKVLTPVPVFAGKQTVWVEGLHSPTVVSSPTPRFYLRLDRQERFGIIRLEPDEKKGKRRVEEWAIIPVSEEVFEQHEDIEVFRREVGYNLYQLWPEQPLEPGEYAVFEFSPGETNIQAWDFSYQGAGSGPD